MAPATAGILCLATGVLGAVSAIALLLWPPQAAQTLVSYPFTTRGFLVAQAWFFAHHFSVLPALVVLPRSPAITSGRVARAGAWLSVFAMVGLSVAELLAMRYAEFDNDVANEGVMGKAYGVTVTAVGIGMVLAGVGVARTRRVGGLAPLDTVGDRRSPCSSWSRRACSPASSWGGWPSDSGSC